MRNIPATAQKGLRDLIAGAVACLFFLHIMALVASANGRFVSANAIPGAAVSISDHLCDGASHDGKKTPTHRHHQHCVLCGVGNRDLALAADAWVATLIVLALPEFAVGPAWVRRGDDTPPPPLGWISSWSSRAPPSYLLTN